MRLPKYFHNLPDRFIERHTTRIDIRKPNLPQYEQKIFKTKRFYYDQWRPWEQEFKRLNAPNISHKTIFVEPIKHWPFFRGDRVEVTRGEDKGKQGVINYIVRERNWIFVKGCRVQSTRMDGVPVNREAPLLANLEVKLVDPSDLNPTDIEWRYDDEGNKVRVSKRTERVIPIPKGAYETKDYVERSAYSDQPKDTPAKEMTKRTFIPEAKTFEMDICDELNIVDSRTPYPMYWY